MTSGSGWEALSGFAGGLNWALLDAYVVELERWNRRIRLVGPRDLEGIRVQVADALLPFFHCPPEFPLLDIGSGAGLPGLAIAIARGEGSGEEVVCLEPLGKRASFLRHVVRQLKLRRVEVLENRAEDGLSARPDLRGYFRTATARAVCEASELLTMSEPYVRSGGQVILPRGDEAPVSRGGWGLEREVPYEGPRGVGRRVVHVYRREQ